MANRVQEIQRKTQPESWRHVPGLKNPADLCSRGVKASELIGKSLWWKGPEWLKGTKKQWPSEIHEKNKEDIETETLKSYLVSSVLSQEGLLALENYSTLKGVVMVTAWIMRFIWNIQAKEQRRGGELTASECVEAKQHWIRLV